MSSFTNWLDKKLSENVFGDDNSARDHDHDMADLIKTVMSKYNSELVGFLKNLANDRNDSELQTLLKNIDTGGDPYPQMSKMRSDRDEIVAPSADRGHAETEE